MMILSNIFFKIWKDPVFSKIISNAIWAFPAGAFITFVKTNNVSLLYPVPLYIPILLIIVFLIIASIKIQVRNQNTGINEKYTIILTHISNILLLDRWENFIDNALRGILIEDFVENQEIFSRLMLSTIWPKKFKNMKMAIENLKIKYEEYLNKFSEHSYYTKGWYKEDQFYKSMGWNKNYNDDLEKYTTWSKERFLCLNNYVYSGSR
jgi:hypothetical protein